MVRRSSTSNTERIDHIINDLDRHSPNFHLVYGDITDGTNIIRLLRESADEIYNLASQTDVHVFFETPEYTADTNALVTLRLLRDPYLGYGKNMQVLSGIDLRIIWRGGTPSIETTIFKPRSRTVAKLYAYWITSLSRAYGYTRI